MEEEYRPISNFPNYEVSNLGNVRNKKRGNVLKPRVIVKKYGYKVYDVSITHTDGKQKHGRIHRLVAEAFIPNPENLLEIDHIDQNSLNNRVDNLRWVTRTENVLNTKIRSDNKSGHRGIYFSSHRKKWIYAFEVKGKKTTVGQFATLEEAVACKESRKE